MPLNIQQDGGKDANVVHKFSALGQPAETAVLILRTVEKPKAEMTKEEPLFRVL
jgi:hypothetical protein